MAAQYLACPASSATVERFFSLAGRLLDKTTANLMETTLEDQMWASLGEDIDQPRQESHLQLKLDSRGDREGTYPGSHSTVVVAWPPGTARLNETVQ